ncbi:MAG: hypothetical protein CSA62_08465 [Planctomycetota bacterium]|nr:MAG: hypothetical protein CSA62_08465 [Planctomycetota bacterium]
MTRILFITILVAALGYGIYALSTGSSQGANLNRADIITAKRGDLRIVVTEDGELEAAKSVKVRSEIEGRNTIEWLIPEGSTVKKGDRLAVLDVSRFSDREETQSISLSRAKSSLVSAETGFEIQESQNASDIDKAQTKLFFAKMDFERFTGQRIVDGKQTVASILSQWKKQAEEELQAMDQAAKGGANKALQRGDRDSTTMSEGQQRLDQSLSDISLKQEELSQSEEKLAWTRRLYAKNYVAEQDLKRDEFAVDKARYNLDVAKSKLRLLIAYDLRKEIRDLESKVQAAQDELGRTKLRCRAQLENKKSDLEAKKQQYEIEVAKLEKLRENIKGGTLLSPSSGLVVYGKSGSWRRQEPIDVGTDVQRGQTILILPDTSTMVAKLKIPEAQRELIKPGQVATLTVESMPGRTFTGHVTFIGQTADTQSSWLNPDIKQYRCMVELHGDTLALRPNMSANVTVEVATLENVLSVPIQAVQRAKNVHFLWVETDSGLEPRLVEIGRANDNRIVIKSGLKEGERVYLHDVDGVERPKFEKENAEFEKARLSKEAQRKQDAAKRRKEASQRQKAGSPRPIEASSSKAEGRRGGSSAMTEIFEMAKAAFPEYAKRLEDPRQRMRLFRDAKFTKTMQEHPKIGPKWKTLMNRFRGKGGRRPQGSRSSGRGPGGE